MIGQAGGGKVPSVGGQAKTWDGQEARAGQSVSQAAGGSREGIRGSRATLSPPPTLPLIPNQ